MTTSSNSKSNDKKSKEQNKWDIDPKMGTRVIDGAKPNTRPNEMKTTVVVNDCKGK